MQSSRNRLLRTIGVDNDAVNWSWLCDRGRFGFEATNSEERLGEPLRAPGRHAHAGALGRRPRAAARRPSAWRRGRPRARLGGGARRRPARPTRASTPGPSWPRASSAPTTSTPSWVTACRPTSCSSLPRATIAEACTPKGTIVPAGPGPQGGARRPLPAPPPRRRRRRRPADRGRPTAAAACSDLRRARACTACPATWPTWCGGRSTGACCATDAGAGDRAASGRRSLTEDPAGVWPPPRRSSHEALPEARFLPTLPRGNVFGALDAGLAPGLLPGRVTPRRRPASRFADGLGRGARGARSRRHRHPAGGRRRPHRGAGAAGRRPDRRLPRPGPGRAGARTGGHGHRRRPVPHRLVVAGPTSCWPPPAGPRSTAPPPTSRAGCSASTRRSRRRARPGRTG